MSAHYYENRDDNSDPSSMYKMLAILMALAFLPIAGVNAEEHISNKQIMDALIIPASDELWSILSEEDVTGKGDDYWLGMENSAIRLMSAASTLITQGPGSAQPTKTLADKKKQQAWNKHAQKLFEAAKQSLLAAQHKSYNEILAASDKLLDSCSACHSDFIAAPPQD